MYSEDFQKAYTRIENVGENLLKYLREMREEKRQEGNLTEELASIEIELERSVNALQNQQYQVAVIAAMKAGKSTFLNATIGADILASESEACTVCRTDIRLIGDKEEPKLLEYCLGEKNPIVISDGSTDKIRGDFLARTHTIRANNNRDETNRFELWHSIAAVSKYSCLNGFTLVDTPGPNEWQSASFNTAALKQTALETLRTCNAILFIFDYTSFKDDTNQFLLKDLIEQRKDFITQNKSKIYFILNKIDQKADRDRSISDVITDLKQTLIDFGITEPMIYPVSARKALLAKLIIDRQASDSHRKDFAKFYMGEYYAQFLDQMPPLIEIARTALKDSNILSIESDIIKTIVTNSGWNLLEEVLAKLAKQVRAIEDVFTQKIRGWEMELSDLEKTVADFRNKAEMARQSVTEVKKNIDGQKRVLIEGYIQVLSNFSQQAIDNIEAEINQFIERRNNNEQSSISYRQERRSDFFGIGIAWQAIGNINDFLLQQISVIGKGLGLGLKLAIQYGLSDKLGEIIPSSSNDDYLDSNDNPQIVRVKNKTEAQKISQTINNFCAPQLQNQWIDIQDTLVREGTDLRQKLAETIKIDIQKISDQLSQFLGESLEVELNINPIQFPSFEFTPIDKEIQHQQAVVRVGTQKKEVGRKQRFCDSDEVYYADVPITEKRSFYEIDLQQTLASIKITIRQEIERKQELMQRVIDRQISEDFHNANRQINEYIDRSQKVLDNLLENRQNKEIESEIIKADFQATREQIEQYLEELNAINLELKAWKSR
jgi:GTPase Era involved in 16S rRNA processing